MDKREYIRQAVRESEATRQGATLSDSETDGSDKGVSLESLPVAIEDLPELPYPPIAASDDTVASRQAGSLGEAMISPHSLKQRRKSRRERWRQT